MMLRLPAGVIAHYAFDLFKAAGGYMRPLADVKPWINFLTSAEWFGSDNFLTVAAAGLSGSNASIIIVPS